MRKSLLSFSAVLLLLSCSAESRVKDKVWEAQLEKLKSPSTAKLAEASVYPESSEQTRKGLFLRQSYALKFSFGLRSGLDTLGLSRGSIGGIKINIPKAKFTEFLYQLKVACPSGAKWIDEMESNKWERSDSDNYFFKIKSEKDKEEIQKILDALIQGLVKTDLENYEKSKNTVECFTVFIKYDAQNAFGAMIRETAMYHVLKIGEQIRIIEKEHDDFVDSLMGTEESKK